MEKILFIDDSESSLNNLRTLISNTPGAEKFEFLYAGNGYEALAKVWEKRPEIIFVDLHMDRLNGHEFCQIIRQNSLFDNTRIYALTGSEEVFDRAKAEIIGIQGYLGKPLSREKMNTILGI